jgi:hypothetical protein
MAPFQITETAYDRKNRRWLFSTPRHHADMTVRPTAGNRIRTSRIASSRVGPLKPGAMSGRIHGVTAMPATTMTAIVNASRAAMAPAARSASSRSPRARSDA